MKDLIPVEIQPATATWLSYCASHGFVDFNHLFRTHQRSVGVFYGGKAALARTVIEFPEDLTGNFRLAWDDQLILRATTPNGTILVPKDPGAANPK